MLDFLKENTFRANDVFLRGLNILKKHYISIAGLCFLLFVTNTFSSFLAMFMMDYEHNVIKIFLLLIFIVLFFGLQLVLIKRSILLSNNIEHAPFVDYLPSIKQFLNFILGLVIYSILLPAVYLVCSLICMPLLYIGVNMDTILWEINPFLTGVIMMLVLIRISFFPFFILEKGFNIIRAFKWSIAFTKGNMTTLLILMFLLAFAYILQMSFERFDYVILAKISGILNTFIIIPAVSVVMATAYVDMLKAYRGSDNPELFKNIF